MAYKDSLIEIANDSLTIKNFHFPMVSKQIPFADIEVVLVLRPTIFNGKYRFWGMGLQSVWFAIDFARANRDAIFVVTIKDKWIRTGFTVEDTADVIHALHQHNIPVEIQSN